MDRKRHWEKVYRTKAPDGVSWFQQQPAPSLRLIDKVGLTPQTWIIDIGGGDSRLVDALLDRGAHCVTVLDISRAALDRARTRLGPKASAVQWIEVDVTSDWPVRCVDVWHDRAVFHFLTDANDRACYTTNLRRVLAPGGYAILATFALDGPASCSGLPVVRYSPDTLMAEIGNGFRVVDVLAENHVTPSGATQAFCWTLFQRDHVSPDIAGMWWNRRLETTNVKVRQSTSAWRANRSSFANGVRPAFAKAAAGNLRVHSWAKVGLESTFAASPLRWTTSAWRANRSSRSR